MSTTLKILTNNLITTLTSIIGLTNSSNITSFTRSTFSKTTEKVDRNPQSFETEGIPFAYNTLLDINAKVYRVILQGPFYELDTLFIGPNSLPKIAGGTIAIRINSLATGYAGTISSVPIYYNQTAVIPPIVLNLGTEAYQEDWVKFGTVHLESGLGYTSVSLEHPGISLSFDQPVGSAVSSIVLYIAQSGSSPDIYTFTDNDTPPSSGDPQYLYTVGLTEFGLPEGMLRTQPFRSVPTNSINDGLYIAYMGLYGQSSEIYNTEALAYGNLYSIATSAGVGLSINSENSSSLINSGSYLAIKSPSRSRLSVRLPLKLVTREVLTRLQVLADRGARVYVQLLSGGDYRLVEERSLRIRDFSRVFWVQSPIVYTSPAYGYYNIEVSLEEV